MGPLEPWMGQLGAASGLTLLLVLLGRAFIANVNAQVSKVQASHDAELKRLTEQHERELGDMRSRAAAWEATANRREATVNELIVQNGKLQGANETAVQLLKALHQVQGRGELGPG